jgi:hypothetical protein
VKLQCVSCLQSYAVFDINIYFISGEYNDNCTDVSRPVCCGDNGLR